MDNLTESTLIARVIVHKPYNQYIVGHATNRESTAVFILLCPRECLIHLVSDQSRQLWNEKQVTFLASDFTTALEANRQEILYLVGQYEGTLIEPNPARIQRFDFQPLQNRVTVT